MPRRRPVELGSNNHFGDPNYFAHTRSFEENGVRHVVEVQSDLAQKAGKMLTPEERAKLEKWQADLSAERGEWIKQARALQDSGTRKLDELQAKGKDASSPEWAEWLQRRNDNMKRVRAAQQDVEARLAEVRSKLDTAGAAERIVPITPMLKNWHKRIIREEIADAARSAARYTPEKRAKLQELFTRAEQAHVALDEKITRFQATLEEQAQFKKLGAYMDQIQDELGRSTAPVIRFADADTVAKVEGWSEVGNRALVDARNQFAIRGPDALSLAGERYGDLVKRLEAEEKAKPAPRFRPEHQGIYDRYAGDITKFLKQLGDSPSVCPPPPKTSTSWDRV